MLPKILREGGRVSLLIDDKPFLILGGEVHNSCASSPEYMEKSVWPELRGLGLNTVAVPIYWELLEPKEGCFCFDLLDGLLAQARREKLRLILLWFGLWKNAESAYAPAWVKKDNNRFFRAQLPESAGQARSACIVSPCCEEAIAADARAFAALMSHLREEDGSAHTVILVQVENEVGLLGGARDLCPAAQAKFRESLPQDIARHFGVSGDWASAFGGEAEALFSSYCFACAVQRIAQAGAKEYPLPLYVNAWTVQYPGERPGSYPSGGPVFEQWKMWKHCAPGISFFSPDIYLTDFAAECDKYRQEGNPLFVPEAHNTVDAAAFSLYVAGCHNALGFSPFGIETIRDYAQKATAGLVAQEAFQQAHTRDNSKSAEYLTDAYAIVNALWPMLEPRRGTPAAQSRLQMNQLRDGLKFEKYGAVVKYHSHCDAWPRGSALLVQIDENKFFAAGTSCSVEFLPAQLGRAETVTLQECLAENGAITLGRILNGDDRHLSFEGSPALFFIELQQLP